MHRRLLRFMTYKPDMWRRLEFEGTPIYVRRDKSGWFVPNKSGDELLRKLHSNGDMIINDMTAARFLERLPETTHYDYKGRASLLQTEELKELWLHITDRCNMRCSHCLFSCSKKKKQELTADIILDISNQAVELGCRIFALTGGEPFVHREIDRIISEILAHSGTHVAVLTNGMNLDKRLKGKPWETGRLHLQISVDGLQENHDRIRGRDAFSRLQRQFNFLNRNRMPFTLSMCVNRCNVHEMPDIISLAHETGASNVHFMWYFVRGRGERKYFAEPEIIFENIRKAEKKARSLGVKIDNIEALKTQVFAPSGTIHDGSGTAWESVALGPDGKLYPSAALVGVKELSVAIEKDFSTAWRDSGILNTIREQTAQSDESPLRYILGGGDIDHSYLHGGCFTGKDPYMSFYEKTALWLIKHEARLCSEEGPPSLRLKMGDILESCGAHGEIALIHSNCLLALAQKDSFTAVKEFYTEAAGDKNKDILNPVCYPEEFIEHIPPEFRFRGYGCGSPVLDAGIGQGETVVDLGCGTGVECFVAARLTGSSGRITGIDMLPDMIVLAGKGAKKAAENLGYSNVEFKPGLLEDLPLQDNYADLALSNCVMNLSVNKRKSFKEVFRILKPGGRFVVSDVVCEDEPAASLKNDEKLKGECIAGAMTQRDLMGILDESGFVNIRILKRFLYRTVQGHPFYSITVKACKARKEVKVKVIYRGPFASVKASNGKCLHAGLVSELSASEAKTLEDQLLILDDEGRATNLKDDESCACYSPPEEKTQESAGRQKKLHADKSKKQKKHRSECMVCGTPLIYPDQEREMSCSYCGRTQAANAFCRKGHFVCDRCHSENALEVIEYFCLNTEETDMIKLMEEIRSHPAVPINGPEHHALVPGIILAAYRNLGGNVSESLIRTGIKRGASVAGGYCAFMGVCGAALGVGIAFSLILKANPLKPVERQKVMQAVNKILEDISAFKAARCCQRDSWIALKIAARLSEKLLPVKLKAEHQMNCSQKHLNKQCLGPHCPLAIKNHAVVLK